MRRSDISRRPRRPDYGLSVERPRFEKEPLAERLVFGEGTVILRATAQTTSGALTIFEEVPPLLDTPLHVHSKEDELFYILEGEHIVQRGEAEFSVRPVTLSAAVVRPRGRCAASHRGEEGCAVTPRGRIARR